MEQYVSHTAFGQNAAMCVNGTFKDSLRTINIDFADIVNSNANWPQKMSFLVSEPEIPYFIGVLLGITPSCIGEYHGSQNNKSFSLIMQDDGLFVKASGPGRSFALKVNPSTVFHIASLVMAHLKPNFNGLSVDEIGRLVRCTVGRYST